MKIATKIMKETWRWFGPQDPISLAQIRQAGATGIVTALHHIYRGEAWPLDEVLKRKAEIESAGLVWSVVESIPVHNSIKLRSGPYRQYIAAWKDSLAAIAKAGVRVVCYNFMPLVDWTRTNLMWRLPSTGYALRFDAVDFAAYDLFLLERPGAELDYAPGRVAAARARFDSMSERQQEELEHAIIAGLPGAESSYNRAFSRIARGVGRSRARRPPFRPLRFSEGSRARGGRAWPAARDSSRRPAVAALWSASRRLHGR